jgi:asparagine synthase (glutamine-hydrolysing)
MFGSETLIEGVRRLPSGHVMVVEGGAPRLQRHFELGYPPMAHRPSDPEAIVDETRTRFTEAVRLHLRSDAPLGLFLSGGIDSTAILAAMCRATGSPVRTFTVGYDPSNGRPSHFDESAAARRVAAHYSTDHHELRLSADEWWTTLGEYVGAGEPIANPSMVTLYALARLAARHVKVALNGTGGDELFAGYRGHRLHPRLLRVGGIAERLVPSSLRQLATGPLWQAIEPFLPALRRRRIVGALPPLLSELRTILLPRPEALRRLASCDGWTVSDTLRRELYSQELGEAWTNVRHAEAAFAEVLAAAVADDPADLVHALTLAGWLPGDGLLALDGVTMAHGLEARVPFFDPPLLSYAASLPPRVRGRGEKWVLREAMRRDLPSFAGDRPKQPFETPLGRWFDRDLGPRLQEVLLDPVCLGRGIFRAGAVEQMLGRHLRREVDHTELIFRLVVLERWQAAVLDAPPPHRTTRRSDMT